MQEMTLDDFLKDFYTEDLIENIEKHDQLNPKLFENDKLKPQVADKINEIVDVFVNTLKEDNIKITIDDIILVGSNVSYNYTNDSDLDIHILANTKNLTCPDNLYPLLYGAYRSIFNKKMEIEFYGIPVEIYVETEDSALQSNGIYSVKTNDWIRHPEIKDIPEVDQDKIKQLEQPFVDRFNEITEKPTVEAIDQLITDIYELRKQGMLEDNAEYSEENLCFKEFRNEGYLDKLKDLKSSTLSKQLSLESLKLKEARKSNHLTSSEIYAMRTLLERTVGTQVLVFDNGKFTISNVRESDADAIVAKLRSVKEVVEAHKVASGKYDFTHMSFVKNMPSRYFIINGQVTLGDK